jgi:hypothetical protein
MNPNFVILILFLSRRQRHLFHLYVQSVAVVETAAKDRSVSKWVALSTVERVGRYINTLIELLLRAV